MQLERLVEPEIAERVIELRRTLHRRPELRFEEHETAASVCEHLRDLDLEPVTGVDDTTGVYVDIESGAPGPIVALRADMDALPLEERTDLDFASEIPGRMHACGHDGHTAALVGAAELLGRHQPAKGKVRLLFQPAEEGGAGARHMIAGGALDGVSRVFGLHLDLSYPVGQAVAQPGALSAFSDRFRIDIHGPGGHGARPHGTVDTVVAASLIVIAMQTIVSRQVTPASHVVVTIGHIEGGETANVIPQRVTLEGTIRTTDAEIRRQVTDEILRIAETAGDLQEAVADVEFYEGYPMVDNDPASAEIAAQAVLNLLGPDAKVPLAEVNLGGEDFAFYQQIVPGCFMRLGADPDRPVGPAHSPTFDFDEAALAIAAALLAECARLSLRGE